MQKKQEVKALRIWRLNHRDVTILFYCIWLLDRLQHYRLRNRLKLHWLEYHPTNPPRGRIICSQNLGATWPAFTRVSFSSKKRREKSLVQGYSQYSLQHDLKPTVINDKTLYYVYQRLFSCVFLLWLSAVQLQLDCSHFLSAYVFLHVLVCVFHAVWQVRPKKLKQIK